MTPALTQLVPLAQELDKNKVTPGVLGFLVFAALGVAVWMLMKNMNKQFTKIDFKEQPVTGRAPEPGDRQPPQDHDQEQVADRKRSQDR